MNWSQDIGKIVQISIPWVDGSFYQEDECLHNMAYCGTIDLPPELPFKGIYGS